MSQTVVLFERHVINIPSHYKFKFIAWFIYLFIIIIIVIIVTITTS